MRLSRPPQTGWAVDPEYPAGGSFDGLKPMVGVGDRAEGNPGSPLCDDFTRVDLIARIGNGLRTGEPA